MSTHKPLTEREKMWATALGLGKLIKERKQGAKQSYWSEKVVHGLELLGQMMTDEFEAELKELASRVDTQSIDILKKILTKITEKIEEKESAWPVFEESDKPEVKDQKSEVSEQPPIKPDDDQEGDRTFAA